MYQTQHALSRESELYPLENPAIKLLNESHWRYIQKRYHLSPREIQVAMLVCSGLNNEQIARQLKIRDGTVKTHLRNIYRRIRVRNKIALLLKFVADASVISPGPHLQSLVSAAAVSDDKHSAD